MNVVVVGCGRVGAMITTKLDQQGHHVSVVDIDPTAFRRLDSNFTGRSIVGTGIDEDILLSAAIDSADALIAVTNSDNTNLMSAQIATSVFELTNVTARVYDPVRAEIFGNMGIRTISPTIVVSSMMLSTLENRLGSLA